MHVCMYVCMYIRLRVCFPKSHAHKRDSVHSSWLLETKPLSTVFSWPWPAYRGKQEAIKLDHCGEATILVMHLNPRSFNLETRCWLLHMRFRNLFIITLQGLWLWDLIFAWLRAKKIRLHAPAKTKNIELLAQNQGRIGGLKLTRALQSKEDNQSQVWGAYFVSRQHWNKRAMSLFPPVWTHWTKYRS